MSANPMELVPITVVLKKLGHKGATTSGGEVSRLIKKYNIEVAAEFKYGRGLTRMMTKAQADSLIAEHCAPPSQDQDAPAVESELRLGAIESKLDRCELELKANTQAVNELIKSANLFADRLNKVLKSLRETTT